MQKKCFSFFFAKNSIEKSVIFVVVVDEFFIKLLIVAVVAVQDEYRLKVTVMEVRPVDHQEYCRRLLDSIRSTGCRADSRPSLGAAPP